MSETNGDPETVFVALGKNTDEGKSTLVWAIQNLEPRKVCILHVHQPTRALGWDSSVGNENELRTYREIERRIMHKTMEIYLDICCRAGVDARVVHLDHENIEKGIVELVYEHSVDKLVIGEAAERHYSPGTADINSRKSKYVRQHAPVSCQLWFICKERLVQTARGDVEHDNEEEERRHHSQASSLYREEKNLRKYAEEALAKEKEEHGKTKSQKDDLQMELDNAVKLTEELLGRDVVGASNSTDGETPHQSFCEYSVLEIQDATSNFDPSLKIADGDNESIYKGLFHYTPVTIKLLHQNTQQGPSEFQKKVEILSKLRHPNVVTFMGACPEIWALVFEYLPNGSLEDRLGCVDDTTPLSWKTRIRIAIELSSVLIFAHSIRPRGIVHGGLNSKEILLDENFICKVNNFGVRNSNPEKNTVVSDIFSFGLILFQLLTGKSSSSIDELICISFNDEPSNDGVDIAGYLDTTAGDWPFLQATQLGHLVTRCCTIEGYYASEVWTEFRRVLESMRVSCGGPVTAMFQVDSEKRRQPPSYFVCPILQETMKDPHVAADGFTYEGEAMRSWLDIGHDTSPMTNVRLEHKTLVPNHSLRSAIQEWLQQP